MRQSVPHYSYRDNLAFLSNILISKKIRLLQTALNINLYLIYSSYLYYKHPQNPKMMFDSLQDAYRILLIILSIYHFKNVY